MTHPAIEQRRPEIHRWRRASRQIGSLDAASSSAWPDASRWPHMPEARSQSAGRSDGYGYLPCFGRGVQRSGDGAGIGLTDVSTEDKPRFGKLLYLIS